MTRPLNFIEHKRQREPGWVPKTGDGRWLVDYNQSLFNPAKQALFNGLVMNADVQRELEMQHLMNEELIFKSEMNDDEIAQQLINRGLMAPLDFFPTKE